MLYSQNISQKEGNKHYPLVSVGILCYNSAETILETLESAYALDYPNMELIISDDGSTDQTLEICKKWLSNHKDKFIKIKVLTVSKNTGTSGNCNRIVKASEGEFVKYLAGDDVFLPNCLKDNIDAIGDAQMVVSQFERFSQDIIYPYRDVVNFDWFFKLPAQERARYYARTSFFCNVPTLFFRRKLYDIVGFYEESEPLLEDIPFLLKVFASESKIVYLPKKTVKYRVGGITDFYNLKFDKILLHSFFTFNINYLDLSKLKDRLAVYERKLYRWLISGKERKDTLLLRYYYSKPNLIYKIFKCYNWRY